MNKTYITVDETNPDHTRRVASMIAIPSGENEKDTLLAADREGTIMWYLWSKDYIPKSAPMLYEVVLPNLETGRGLPFSLS